MNDRERSRCIQWRLGWFPGCACIPVPSVTILPFQKKITIQCLKIHGRLHISHQHPNPLSLLLNQLRKAQTTSPKRIQYLTSFWPIICSILMELDAYHHPNSNQQQYQNPIPGAAPTKWIASSPSSDAEKNPIVS